LIINKCCTDLVETGKGFKYPIMGACPTRLTILKCPVCELEFASKLGVSVFNKTLDIRHGKYREAIHPAATRIIQQEAK